MRPDDRNTNKRPPRVLLLAGDTRWNVGDRAIRAGLCALLREACPGVDICGLSRTPARDAAEFGMRTVGASPAAIPRVAVWRPDLVVWGGGQLLQDDSSQVKNPFWAAVLGWVRATCRARILGCGLGVGPLQTRWGRHFAARALRQADALIVRDERSAQLAASLAARAEPIVAADLAVAVPAAPADAVERYLDASGPVERPAGDLVVGVVLRRWFHVNGSVLPYAWAQRSGLRHSLGAARLDRFMDHAAEALDRVARGRRLRYWFLPFSDAPWDRDRELTEAVARRMRAPSHVLRLDCPAATVKGILGRCDLVVTSRLHAAILALDMGRPVVGIPYASKVDDLLAKTGSPCLGMDAVAEAGGATALGDVLEHALSTMPASSARAADEASRLRARLQPYRDLFDRELAGKAVP